MSIAIWLEINTGIQDTHVVEVGSFTSLASKIWDAALEMSLKDLNGKSAELCVDILSAAVDRITNRPDKFQRLDLSTDHCLGMIAMACLYSLFMACKMHPKCIVRMHY